jgi:hypothetical protein
VLDFGLVWLRDDAGAQLTQPGDLLGTAAYMSPEQARGKPLTASADLFALGVVLWELLTGKRLFAGESDAETLDRVTRCELPSLSAARPDLPPDIEPILRRALAPDPADRYASADEMLTHLRRCLLAQAGADDPRKQLAAIMHQHFDEQAKYRSAALRGTTRVRTGPRMHLVRRPNTGAHPTVVSRSRGDTPLVLLPPVTPTANEPSGPHPRPGSDSNPVVAESANTLTVGPGRHWGLWFALPMLGAGLAVAILLAVFRWREDIAPGITESSRAATEVVPPGPQRDLLVVPRRIVWNFESEPAGAQVSISGAPPAVAADIEAQLSGRLTPFSIEIPHDEHTRIEVRFTRPGYKVSRRSLLPISSENINVSLQPEASGPPPESAGKRKPVFKQAGTNRFAQQKNPPSPTVAGDELKDEPTFGSPKDRGPR